MKWLWLCYNQEMSGERGENPLRARRRKCKNPLGENSLTCSHMQGQAIGEYLRRLPVGCIKPEYPDRNIPVFFADKLNMSKEEPRAPA